MYDVLVHMYRISYQRGSKYIVRGQFLVTTAVALIKACYTMPKESYIGGQYKEKQRFVIN